MNDYPVQLLTKMLEIYSPTGKEEKISDFLLSEMEHLGFKARKDAVQNVIGEVGNGKPTVLLCGHMDTVPGHIPVRIENGKLYGRGAVDAKAPLAAMIVASSLLAEELSNKILVAGVVEEEGLSRGVKQLIKDGVTSDYAVFGEPSGTDKITIGYKGSLHLKITCETQTGHSSAPWLYENAVERAFDIWNEIKALHLEKEKADSHFYSINSALVKMTGGKVASEVASKCDMHIDLRFPPQFTSNEVFTKVAEKIDRYRSANPKVAVVSKTINRNEPFEVDPKSPLVRAFSWSVRKVRHKSAMLLRKTGTGDMNIFGKALRVPSVTYGPGDSHLDHTSNENIDIQDYLDSIQVYREAVKRLVRRDESGN
jgi:LysW-gamma-L-lysine carboxypeptidase